MKRMVIALLLACMSSWVNAWSNQSSTGKITHIRNYSGGQVSIALNVKPAVTCWNNFLTITPSYKTVSDIGYQNLVATALSALHSGKKITIWYEDDPNTTDCRVEIIQIHS